MDGILKVDPQVIEAKASEMLMEKNQISITLEQVKADINSLAIAWKGTASDEFLTRFKQVYNDIDLLLAIAQEYGTDLNEIAQIHRTAETAATNIASGVPVDGVIKI